MKAFDLMAELKKHNVLPKESIVTNFDISEYICSHIDESGDFSINLDVYEKEVVDDTIIVRYQCVENHISNERFVINLKLGFVNRKELYFELDDIVPWVYEGEQDEEFYEEPWLQVPFVYHNQLLAITGLGDVVFSSKITDLPEVPTDYDREPDYKGGIEEEKLREYIRFWNK